RPGATAFPSTTLFRSWVIGALGSRTTPKAVAAGLPLPEPVVAEVLSHLWGTGMLVLGEETGIEESGHGFCEDTDPALAAWSHHRSEEHTSELQSRENL